MPVTLPNGIQIFNATPHDLIFSDYSWEERDIIVPSEGFPINAFAHNVEVGTVGPATLVTLNFTSREDGLEIIKLVREKYPNALIVGSVIAAQAYPEEVVAPIPRYRGDRGGKRSMQPLMKPDRFTIFLKEQ